MNKTTGFDARAKAVSKPHRNSQQNAYSYQKDVEKGRQAVVGEYINAVGDESKQPGSLMMFIDSSDRGEQNHSVKQS